MDWRNWFAGGERVVALPGWRRARLLVPSRGAGQRWRDTGLYPAVTRAARARRLGLRLAAAGGGAPARLIERPGWPLGEWLADVLPGAAYAVVRYGTPSRVQKVVACVVGHDRAPIGFVKYAELPGARLLLRREQEILGSLPTGVGPSVLKTGEFDGGEAVALEAVAGEPLPVTPAPTEAADAFLQRLKVGDPLPLDRHPGAERLRAADPGLVGPWLAALGLRRWPVAVQHGDFVPWNLLRDSAGVVRAVDWEYAQRPGLPYLDWCHHVLQIALLVRRWSVAKTRRFACERLMERFSELDERAARAVVSLTAFEGYLLRRSEGFGDDDRIQRWRRELWSAG